MLTEAHKKGKLVKHANLRRNDDTSINDVKQF